MQQQYDYQLQQFRKLPNPSDRKPALAGERDDDSSGSDNTRKSGKKITTSEAVELFQARWEKEKVRTELAVTDVTVTQLQLQL
jgi:hypothetical protein